VISKARFQELASDNRIWWGEDGNNVPAIKRFLSEVLQGRVPQTIWPYKEVGHTQEAKKEVVSLIPLDRPDEVFQTPKPTRLIQRVATIGADEDSLILDYFAGSGTTGHAVINLNREDGGTRKYVLVEMGDYFDTVLKPRVEKVIYSKDWKDGKPVSREGSSHCFKVIRLESYDDTLGNISFDSETAQGMLKLMEGDEYLLNYMLEFETRGSETLLNTARLATPFSYRLEVLDGRERRLKPVDLPETFNYLLGLRVRTRRVLHRTKGKKKLRYLVVTGATNPNSVDGEREVAVIWRETAGWKKVDLEADREFVLKHKLTDGAKDIYVNGDSLIPGATCLDGLFKQRMFAGVE